MMRTILSHFSTALLFFATGLLLAGCGGGEQPNSSSSSGTPSDTESPESETSGDESVTEDSGNTDDGGEVATEGWGNLKAKFIVTGAPTPDKISVDTDVAYCGKYSLANESVVAGPGGELANVILIPYTKRGEEPREPHDSYADAAESVTLDNLHCRFEPHVAILRTTQKLQIKNSDPVGHNTKINSEYNPINPIVPPGQDLIVEGFKKAERMPAATSCSIHPWMKAWVVISDSPYAAASNKDGEVLIENLPAGKHTFTVWHEKGGYLSDVSVGGKATEWSRGRVDVVIKDGETTNLGDVTVTYAKLAD